MKKVLFICGSHRNGNCKLILEQIQQTFWLEHRTELVFLRDFEIDYADDDLRTAKDAHYYDKTPILIDKILESDIIVLATPNYFYNVSGLTKVFFDRTHELYKAKKLSQKKFLFIYIGNDEEKNTKLYLDNAVYGFIVSHNLNALGSFAFSASDVGTFSHPDDYQKNITDIQTLLRENLE